MNYRESEARSKHSIFFLFHQKKPLSVSCFQKQYSKAPAKLWPKPGRRPEGN